MGERIPFVFENAEPRILPGCRPSKIACVGRNYVDHAKELGNPVPAEPLIFFKPVSSMIPTGAPIVYPAISEFVSFEGELGVVIGKRTRNVRAEDAEAFIFGYTCVNDVTDRDAQQKDGQWTRAKGFDTFCPMGPWIETEGDPNKIEVRTLLNGQIRQNSHTGYLIFKIPYLIAFISEVMTLMPGDIIATGTPEGIGQLNPGDVVEIKVEGVGTLRNQVRNQA